MSAIRRLNSFSLVKNPKQLSSKSISTFYFPFDAGDMCVMHGNKGKLAEMGGVQGIAGALRTDLRRGLYGDEVSLGTYAERKKIYGENVFEKPPLKPFWLHCWLVWNDPILMLLTASGFFSLIVKSIEHPASGFVEGLAIIIAVALVVFVGAANNSSQERAFRALDDGKEEEFFKVWRDGKKIRVAMSEVVVGDLVELTAGDAVPADGVFVFGDDPATNEAKMTGESRDIPKDPANPWLLGGTELKRGALNFLVTSVGPNTSYGRIMAALSAPNEETPLQEKLGGLAETISKIGAVVSLVLFIVNMIFWGVDLSHGDSFSDRGTDLIDFVIISITLLVVAVPEGLPLAVTLSLAYAMKRMVADKNLVRVLAACETMGNATCICSDKTGTLTQNRMTVVRGWVGKAYEKTPTYSTFSPNLKQMLIQCVVVNSAATQEVVGGNPGADKNFQENVPPSISVTASTDEDTKEDTHRKGKSSKGASVAPNQQAVTLEMAEKKEPVKVWTGNQTEIALLEWLSKYHVNVPVERRHRPVYKNYPFDSMKKNSSVILKHGSGWRRCYKGAAEQLFAAATHILSETGEELPKDALRQEVTSVIEAMTKTGLRTIGFLYEDFDHIETDPKDPNKLADPPAAEKSVFVGVVGIKDPLRAESRASVRTAQRAGIVVRMVTGDHPDTAKFIATECGILTAPHHVTMVGDEFRKLIEGSQAEAEKIIPNMRVLARSKPEDKQLLVRWLKNHGHVVAATGDGTNDAPALKEADVGIAMFIAGTAVAKQAAHILILDDNFASIVKSIMWGRSVFDNIRKFVQFQLTINIVALAVSLIGAFSNYNTPLAAVQLLWVNLIMDTLAALALGTELPQVTLLDRRPYSRDANLINQIMWKNMIGHSLFQVALLLMILYDGARIWGLDNKSRQHYTMIFNTFVFFQIFNEFNARQVTGDKNVFKDLFANHVFWIVTGITIGFQILMVEAFGVFASTDHLTAGQWWSCIGLGALSIPWGFVVREIPVNVNDGFIEIPEGTFDGANLEEHEPDEIGHPNYHEFIKRRHEEEAALARPESNEPVPT